MALPDRIDPRAFDALHDDPAAWRGAMLRLARRHGADAAAVRLESAGTVLVARLGTDRVIKLFPPFLRDHHAFECAMLQRLQGRLRLETPRLLDRGDFDGWPYIVMSQLSGQSLTETWPTLSEPRRCALLGALGELTAEVHALPVDDVAGLAPPWADFIAAQRARCAERQRRTGLPAPLQAALATFIAGPVPEGPTVLLTGEYTPMNLYTRDGQLTALFDFGDGLVGPRAYDWLGPLCFLAAGHAARCVAFMAGAGVRLDDGLRLVLMRLLLLHRYSHLKAQIACDGWQQATTFEALAQRIWPAARA